MVLGKVAVSAVLAFALLNTAAAQSLSVTPGGGLTVGGKATIDYSNPARGGQTITVKVSGGFPVVSTVEVPITLDAKGRGTGSWIVSNWAAARFNAPDVHEVAVAVRG